MRLVIGLWLILTGGSINLYQRFIAGGIVDNLHIGRLDFNVADVMIVIGCLVVTVGFVLNRPRRIMSGW